LQAAFQAYKAAHQAHWDLGLQLNALKVRQREAARLAGNYAVPESEVGGREQRALYRAEQQAARQAVADVEETFRDLLAERTEASQKLMEAEHTFTRLRDRAKALIQSGRRAELYLRERVKKGESPAGEQVERARAVAALEELLGPGNDLREPPWFSGELTQEVS